MPDVSLMPSFAEERMLEARGYRLIAGIDEVGCGALAGPVVAVAVILPGGIDVPWMAQVRDSKQLRPAVRELLCQHIHDVAISIGVGMIPHDVIDGKGLTRARRLAMKLAVEQLSPQPEWLLIDYFRLPEVPLPQKGITNGDELCFSIACASIVAKVTRDRIMTHYHSLYPLYGFIRHKGYGTSEHLRALREYGPSPIHRMTFHPVCEMRS